MFIGSGCHAPLAQGDETVQDMAEENISYWNRDKKGHVKFRSSEFAGRKE